MTLHLIVVEKQEAMITGFKIIMTDTGPMKVPVYGAGGFGGIVPGWGWKAVTLDAKTALVARDLLALEAGLDVLANTHEVHGADAVQRQAVEWLGATLQKVLTELENADTPAAKS
jgi:hypothetical protein